jgi:hypothetical protein
MRALEVHSSERKLCGDISPLDVLVIRYEDSVEFYQHMSTIEIEKKSFQQLAEIKLRLNLDNRPEQQERCNDVVVVDTREFACSTPIHL